MVGELDAIFRLAMVRERVGWIFDIGGREKC